MSDMSGSPPEERGVNDVPGPPAVEGRASNVRPPSREAPSEGRQIPWKVVIWAVVAVYAVLFLLLNNEKQSVSFVFFSVKTRLIWLILLSMALGAALATIGPRWWRSRNQ